MKSACKTLILCIAGAMLVFGWTMRTSSQALLPPVEATEPGSISAGPTSPQTTRPTTEPPSETPRKVYGRFAAGLFVKRAYVAEDAVLPVEIWSVIVAPGPTQPARFPGAVMFELIDGELDVIEPKLGTIRSGGTFGVSEGGSVALNNQGNRPATLRAVIVRGEGN